jgi:ribA/ribD-fused uncharacterized protein
MQSITSFQDNYRFLSNFWPCHIEWKGMVYSTLEHAYVSSKVENPEVKILIQSCPTPGDAKEFLATHNIKRVSSRTKETKLQVMEELLFIKFGGKEPLLTRALMETSHAELIEGNTWNDTYWGVCNNLGENHLGKLLMKVRAALFEEKKLIEKHVPSANTHQQLADLVGMTRQCLYEKMMAFEIPQRKYLGY